MKIYLAGGMRPRPERPYTTPHFFTKILDSFDSWQDAVRWAMSKDNSFFDPRQSDTKVFEDYSFLDLMALRQCDLVIAYLEAENPSGMGLAAEIAFAKGLGKTVLLVNEQSDNRYVKFIENFADRVFTNLAEAMPLISKIR